MQWHTWLRHCATSCKVTGVILDGIIEIFHFFVALGLIQPLTEMSTKKISWWVKAASA